MPKSAVTVVAELIVTTQVPVPEQPPPDQPVNVDPDAAEAVNVPLVPVANDALHVAPQLIPLGDDVTVPEPDPDFDTVNVDVGIGANAAVIVVAELIVTTHVPVPEQPPPDQ